MNLSKKILCLFLLFTFLRCSAPQNDQPAAKVVPSYNKSKAFDGFKISGIQKGGVFEMLDLQNGDVLHQINDVKLNHIEKSTQMLQELKTKTDFVIHVTRKGKPKEIHVSISE